MQYQTKRLQENLKITPRILFREYPAKFTILIKSNDIFRGIIPQFRIFEYDQDSFKAKTSASYYQLTRKFCR